MNDQINAEVAPIDVAVMAQPEVQQDAPVGFVQDEAAVGTETPETVH